MAQSLRGTIRLSFKLHGYEFAAALLTAVAVATWALAITVRSDVSRLDPACMAEWAALGADASQACAELIGRWGATIVSESPTLIGALAYVPFAVGLLAGVPIVAREIESGTIRTAWALFPDRTTWLIGQSLPIFLMVLIAMMALAVTSDRVENYRMLWGYSPVDDLGKYGHVLVSHYVVAFSIGLGVGSLLGRTLPALVLGTAIVLALSAGTSLAHQLWSSEQTLSAISEGSGPNARSLSPGSVFVKSVWRAPDGRELSTSDAVAAAHSAGVPLPAPDDQADSRALEWLEASGYVPVGLGVSRDVAVSWANWEAGGLYFVATGFATVAAFAVLRRRPR